MRKIKLKQPKYKKCVSHVNGYLNLKEVGVRLDQSPSWINKVQRITGKPKPIGSFGVEQKFTSSDIEQLRFFKVLRFMGFDIEDLSKLDKKELNKKRSTLFGDLIWFENNMDKFLTE